MEANGLNLIGKTIHEVERTMQFDTITFLTAFGDVWACLTETTVEYNKAARIRIIDRYNTQIKAIPARIHKDIELLVSDNLKSIGAPADIIAKDVISG